MSITTPFEEARRALGLADTEADPAAIKRAYRVALAAHPPDVDPDAFRRIRDAYELLRDPWARAVEILNNPVPQTPPPSAPAAPPAPPRGATAVALLRFAVLRADPQTFAKAAPTRARSARSGTAKETT